MTKEKGHPFIKEKKLTPIIEVYLPFEEFGRSVLVSVVGLFAILVIFQQVMLTLGKRSAQEKSTIKQLLSNFITNFINKHLF